MNTLKATQCELCQYQHGHQIGCANNPVDIALKAQDAVVQQEPLSREEREVVMSSIRDGCDLIHAGVMQQEPVACIQHFKGDKGRLFFYDEVSPPPGSDAYVDEITWTLLYPPTAKQAKPQPLSDEQKQEIIEAHAGYGGDDFLSVISAVERHYGIKE